MHRTGSRLLKPIRVVLRTISRRSSYLLTAFLLLATLVSQLVPAMGAEAYQPVADSLQRITAPPPSSNLRPVAAPVASVSLDVPGSVFIGESFSFTATFDNTSGTDTDVGYGPYIDVYLPLAGTDGAGTEVDDGISFLDANYLGASLSPISPTPLVCSGGSYTHPLTGLTTSCVDDMQVVVLQLPFGSFVPDQPAAVITINADMSVLADLGTPLAIQASGGFMYGADPLDNPITDPPILGGLTSVSITPTLMTLSKSFSGEENETATGPSWLQTYTLTIDIADGQTLTSIDLMDYLPNNIAFHDIVSISPAPHTVTTPPVDVPFDPATDSFLVEFTSVTGGTGENDVVVTFSFFVPEFDSDDVSILDPLNGGCVQITNDVAATANWDPIDTRDAAQVIVSDDTPNDQTFDACAMVIRKDLNITTDASPSGASPDDIITYAYRIDVSDYFTLGGVGSDTWAFDDVMSDGQLFLFGDIALGVDATYTFNDRAGVSAGTFSDGGYLTVDTSVNPDYGAGGVCGAGTTSLHFDLSGQVVADDDITPTPGNHPDAVLVGGCVGSSGDPLNPCGYPAPEAPATARIEYRAQIQEVYACEVPSGDHSLDQDDDIDNEVDADAAVLDNVAQSPTGGRTVEDSSEAAVLDIGTLTKVIYARNGVVISGPGTPQFAPGDTITYRLTYTTPTSDIEDFALIDFLPLPVLQVDDVDADNVYGDAAFWVFNYVAAGPGDTPAVGEAMWGPGDTFHLLVGGNPATPPAPTISVDIPANSLTFTIGDYDNDNNPTSTIDILFTITVQDDPFADGLFLTNQVRSTKNNSFLETTVQDDIVQFILTEPVLAIVKGVVESSNADGVFSLAQPLPAGVDFSQGACPSLTSGAVTSDGLAANPIDSDLSAVDAGDVVTYAIVIENTGSGLTGVFDLVVQDVLPPEIDPTTDVSNICAMDGTGAAIAIFNVGGGSGLFDQGIVLEDPGPVNPQEGVLEPYDASSGRNIAVITYDVTLPDDVEPSLLLTNTASVLNYANIEGGDNFIDTFGPLEDDANVSVRRPDLTKTITATNQAFTTPEASPWPVAIGEIIEYEVVIAVPEGVSNNVTFEDTLDPGLAFVSLDSLVVSDTTALTTDVLDTGGDVGGFDEIFAAGVISAVGSGAENDGRRVTFDFGTLTNTDRDNATDETITLTYHVVVLNTTGTDRGDTLNNDVVWTWDLDTETTAAPTAQIVEPTLQVVKSINTNTGDAGDTRTYTITVSHASGSNATAFDLELYDTIPAGVTYVPASLDCTGGSVSPDTCTVVGDQLTATWTSAPGMEVGETTVITFDVTIDDAVSAGQVILNTAYLEWTSLPDPDGNSAQSTHNTLSVERTGDVIDVGGAANDYNTSSPISLTIEGGPVKNLIASSEAHTDDSSGTEYLAIGEIVRYHLSFQLPESTSSNLQFRDLLPAGLQFINDGTATVGFVANDGGITSTTLTPAGLSCTGVGLDPVLNWADNDGTIVPECPLPDDAVSASATTDNDTYGDGTDIYFSFGDVVNTDRDPDMEYVVIAFNALVLNVSGNQAEDTTPNHGNRFDVLVGNATVDTSNTVDVRVAEPYVTLSKSVATAPQDAGDTVVYRLLLDHPSDGSADEATAFNLALTDTLNPLYLDLQGVEIDPLTTPPDYATVLINPDVSGNVVAVAVDELRPGDSITILVTAIVLDDVPAGETIENTAYLNYASLPAGTVTDPNPTGSPSQGGQGSGMGARDGSGGVNDYNDQDVGEVNLTPPDIDKYVSPSSYTIGEEVTFDLVVTLPEGVTQDLVVVDNLRAGLSAISYEVITDDDLSGGRLTDDFAGSLPAPTVSIPGGNGADVTFTFGDTTTTADNDTGNNAFLLRVTARVLNVIGNQRGVSIPNDGSLFYTDPEDGPNTEILSNTVNINLVEPELQVVKLASDDQPTFNETVTYTLTISHLPTSGHDAYEVSLQDVIPAGLTYVGGSLDCTSGAQDPDTCSISGDTITATWSSFLNDSTMAVITYQATVAGVGVVSLDQDITNNASVTWTSMSATQPEERTSGNGYLNAGGLNDYENPTSETVTVTGPDLAIDKDDGLTAVVPGQTMVYTLQIDNNGNGLASGIEVEDVVPEHTRFNAGSSTTGWVCDDPDGGGPLNPGDPGSTCRISLADLAGGATTSVSFALTLDTPLPVLVEQVENIASVTDDGTNGPDPTPADNTDNDIDVIDAAPDLTIDKDDGIDIIAEGSSLNYTLTYQNVGDQDATGVTITDVVPVGTTFNAAASDSGWVCDDPDGAGPDNPGDPGSTCTLDIGPVPAGAAAATVQFVLDVDIPLAPSVTQIENIAVIADDGANGDDPTPENNTDNDIDNISAVFTKDIIATSQAHTSPESAPWTAAIGEILTYELQLVIPPGTKQNLTIVDVLEPGLAFVGCLDVSGTAGLSTSLAGGFTDACDDPANPLVQAEPVGDSDPLNEGRRISFNLGDVNQVDGSDGTLTIRYQVVVLNNGGNNRGDQLRNTAVANWTGSRELSASAPQVTLVEPDLMVEKTTPATTVLNGDSVPFVITIEHSTATNADAFDVLLTDILPPELSFDPTSVVVTGPAPNSTDFSDPFNLEFRWNNFPQGTVVVVEFEAVIDGMAPGENTTNRVQLEWTSLPDDDALDPYALSDYNSYATERYYDPGSVVNVYGASDSLILTVPELPATGFAPGVVTTLPPARPYTDLGGMHLSIPVLDVDIPIVGVPTGDDGWDLTWLYNQAGWLAGTAYPTWPGNTALTAHVTLPDGLPGPFAGLDDLRWGDEVVVETDSQRYTYRVSAVWHVQPTDLSVLGHSDYDALTLITCEGYDSSRDEYRGRVAVRAVLMTVEER